MCARASSPGEAMARERERERGWHPPASSASASCVGVGVDGARTRRGKRKSLKLKRRTGTGTQGESVDVVTACTAVTDATRRAPPYPRFFNPVCDCSHPKKNSNRSRRTLERLLEEMRTVRVQHRAEESRARTTFAFRWLHPPPMRSSRSRRVGECGDSSSRR